MLYSTMAIFTCKLCIATTMMQVSFLPPYYVTRMVVRRAHNKDHKALPKSVNSKTPRSTQITKLSFALQNIKNTNKLSRVTSCLKFTYFVYLLWQFFSWLDSPSRPKSLHFQGLITFRNGLHEATLYTAGRVAQLVQRLTTGWTVRDQIPVGTRFSACPDQPWGPPSLL